MTNTDFQIPDGLSKKGEASAKALIKLAQKMNGSEASGGGCRAFYTPEQWKERGEEYGLGSELIVVHDGGDLCPFLNWDYECYDAVDKSVEALKKVGTYAESCTCWYTAIYPTGND